MPTELEKLPARIRNLPCEKCGEAIPDDVESVLTFTGGNFVRLHEECADYMDHATKGPRQNDHSAGTATSESQLRNGGEG